MFRSLKVKLLFLLLRILGFHGLIYNWPHGFYSDEYKHQEGSILIIYTTGKEVHISQKLNTYQGLVPTRTYNIIQKFVIPFIQNIGYEFILYNINLTSLTLNFSDNVFTHSVRVDHQNITLYKTSSK